MDTQLLHFFNHQFVHPLLDVIMVLASTAGLALLPTLALHAWLQNERKLAKTLVSSLIIGLLFALTFQFLAMRPRPEEIRLLLPQPPFPAFPSGHATVAFAIATVFTLHYRRWALSTMSMLVALLISISRLYLGQHYPTDIMAGTLLGVAMGAACYGWFGTNGDLPDRLRWWLFPQIAVAVIVSMMAYLDLLPMHLLRWHYIDKIMHFLLWGSLAFWLNLWLKGRAWQIAQHALPMAIFFPFSIALLEEGFQSLSPLRTADVTDLSADLLGLICFWWLSGWVMQRSQSTTASSQNLR